MIKDDNLILSIAGHDPTGGAGIQVDAQIANYHGKHCLSILTCETIQNLKSLLKSESSIAAIDIISLELVFFNPTSIPSFGKPNLFNHPCLLLSYRIVFSIRMIFPLHYLRYVIKYSSIIPFRGLIFL